MLASLKEVRDTFRQKLKEENYTLASSYADELIARWPENPTAWDARCRVAIATLSSFEALNIVRFAYARHSDNVTLASHLVNTLNKIGNITESERIATQSLSLKEGNKRLEINLARVYQCGDRWVEARQRWREMELTGKEDPTVLRGLLACALNLGEVEEALGLLECLADLGLSKPLDKYHYVLLEHRMTRSICSPQASLEVALRHPDDTSVQIAHSRHLSKLGLRRDAISFIKKQLAQGNMDNNALRIEHARLYESSRQFSEALDLHTRTLAENPTLLAALFGKIRCYIFRDELDLAKKHLEDLSQGEASPMILEFYAQIAQRQGDDKTCLSKRISAFRLRPSLSQYCNLCVSLMEVGRFSTAKSVLYHLIDMHGENMTSWREIGGLYLNLKRFSESERWTRRFIDVNPSELSTLHWSTLALWQLGDLDKANQRLSVCITSDSRYLSSDRAVSASATSELRSSIQAFSELKKVLVGTNEFIHQARKLRSLVTHPLRIKSPILRDSETRDFLKSLNSIDSALRCDCTTSQLRALRSEIDNHCGNALQHIVDNCSNGALSGDLLYRVAGVYERLDEPIKALECLKQAIFCAKEDRLIFDSYTRLLRKVSPKVTLSGEDRVAVLMVTCNPNRAVAEHMATHLFHSSGQQVFTVHGCAENKGFELTQKPYGYHLTVPCADNYLALSEKLLLAYRYLYTCTNCVGVLKLDDDVVLEDAHRFRQLLDTCRSDPGGYVGWVSTFANSVYHHGRHQSKTTRPVRVSHDPVAYCTGGEGYYLSRRNLRIIQKSGLAFFDLTDRSSLYEDVYFGEILSRAGVKPTHLCMYEVGGYITDVFEPLNLLDNALSHTPIPNAA